MYIMKNTFTLISFTMGIAFLMIQCKPMVNSSYKSEKTLIIASETKDCTAVAPMKCLQVKEKESESWSHFYSNIEGFTYESGFEYVLKVKTEKIENPPIDSSSVRYILVKEVSKTKK